jgi:tetratricopeptide (TPR) repeat protein
MRLMISYSRDDKKYVYNVRDELQRDYSVWIDTGLVGGTRWWETILDEIERCDVVLAMFSPRAVESIYCRAEIDYALDLGKPIIPVMLKMPCDYPERLARRQIQYIDVSQTSNFQYELRLIDRAISQCRFEIQAGKYLPHDPKPMRPPVPSPSAQDSVDDVFAAAATALDENDLTLAKKLYQQVIDADPQGFGLAARKRLDNVRMREEREKMYQNIVKLAKRSGTLDDAVAMWEVYVGKYGDDYDPQGLGEKLTPTLVAQEGGGTTQNAQELANIERASIAFKLAEKKRKQWDWKGALANYTEAIKFDPQNDEAYYCRALVKDEILDYDGAIADYSEAIYLNSHYTNAYVGRGFVRALKNQLDGAIADFTEGIRLDPSHADAYIGRGTVRQAQNELDGAIADFTEFICLNPQYASAYNNRGNARKAKGDLDGAIADYDEAINLNPQDADAYFNRGIVLEMKNDLAGAIADWEQYLRFGGSRKSKVESLIADARQKLK